MDSPDVLLFTPDEARRALARMGVHAVEWRYTGPPGRVAAGADDRVVRQRWREGVLQLTLASRGLASGEPPGGVREASL